jgi:aryl-alcohol dehydrogenase-like predicted oxidoreductase
MEYRELGRTGWQASAISFGAWAIGGTWGTVDDQESMASLHRALDLGVNFFDTADVYGNGRSERLLARLRRERPEAFYVATKTGRRLNPHVAGGYTRQNLTAFVERSLKNLETEAIDLLQSHCPPAEVYYKPQVFGVLDDFDVLGGDMYITGAKRPAQAEENLKAVNVPPLSEATMAGIREIYNQYARPHVHQYW